MRGKIPCVLSYLTQNIYAYEQNRDNNLFCFFFKTCESKTREDEHRRGSVGQIQKLKEIVFLKVAQDHQGTSDWMPRLPTWPLIIASSYPRSTIFAFFACRAPLFSSHARSRADSCRGPSRKPSPREWFGPTSRSRSKLP